ncbi:hypothetical protein, partial [Streptomyces brasiliscabiei]|uniref:hypothetical protein n=1 Tax=Streptomyces brasiliscabiei TaxID=2736302 RepID=UPI00301535D3
YSGEARKIGFHNGDIPLLADGQALGNPAEGLLKMTQAKEVTVLRQGKETTIKIPSDFMLRLDAEARSDTAMVNFMDYRIPAQVSQTMNGEG